MAHLQLDNVYQSYGRQQVVAGVSFAIASGTIACLLGSSGCGKTTLLRCIAGFEPVIGGSISLAGSCISRAGFTMPPEKRRIGMVFQDYALFPHLNVLRNVTFGLDALPAAERRTRGEAMLATVGLAGQGAKYPHELSGGQQQRVALARALAPSPGLILLDEPFSNLDVDLRERLSREVRTILKREGMTALLVTHDQNEAFAMADEVGVMDGGRIAQWATPDRLYHQPANRFVANFIGEGTFLAATAAGENEVTLEFSAPSTIPHAAPLPARLPPGCGAGSRVDVLLRPDDVIIDPAGPLQASVTARAFRGANILYTLRLDGGSEVLALLPSRHEHLPGSRVGIRLASDRLLAFAPAAEVAGAA